MVKTTRLQREALFKVFQRDFPSWVTPTRRTSHPKCSAFDPLVKVPSTVYRRFLKMVRPGPGCIMVPWQGMWLGIEADGYTHS